ncbi:hypothetical protein [uncultured Tateyamaria sp.]|uniref:hypothetical protein n=1 Tax=uncultured Tateyamaria sp. TaxID=455651 RepID=UPI00263662DE|nr:hypothetical protein [uncultured Tateyamaria sp.]
MNPAIIAAAVGGMFGLGRTYLSNRSARQSEREGRAFSERQYYNDLSATYGDQAKTVVGKRRGPFGIPVYDKQPEIYGGKGSDLLGRDRDLEYSGKHLQQVFDVGAQQGLTPQEIAGSPAAGGTGRSGGNAVLGQSNAAASATQATLRNAAADRATTERVASMRAQTDLAVAAIQSGVNVLGQETQAETQRRGQDVGYEATKYASDSSVKAAVISGKASNISAAIASAPAAARVDYQNTLDTAMAHLKAAEQTLVYNRLAKAEQESLGLVLHLYKTGEINGQRARSAAMGIALDAGLSTGKAVLSGGLIRKILRGGSRSNSSVSGGTVRSRRSSPVDDFDVIEPWGP